MKLNRKEADIIACAQFRADMSAPNIARETGYRVHTVHYCLRSLVSRGIMRRVPAINITPAGYIYIGLYFSIAARSRNTVAGLVGALQKMKEVVWLCETGGEFQIGMAVCLRGVHELDGFMSVLSGKFPGLFFEKSVSFQFSASAYPRKYLSEKSFRNQPFTIIDKGEGGALDHIDRTVLGGLSSFGHYSMRELAVELKMPVSTLDLRLGKLKEKGILLGFIYELDAKRIGMQTHTLLVYARGINRQLDTALSEFAARHTAVTHLYRCFGAWDYEINIEVRDEGEIVTVEQELYGRLGEYINTVKALSKYREVKYTYVPF